MFLRALLPLCACLLAGCSVFPDSPPQVTQLQDSGTDADSDVVDAADEPDVSVEADAPQEADVSVEADALEEPDSPEDDVSEGGDADDAADALESGDAPGDAPDHCYDADTNFDETDLNCGGAECPRCKKNESCLVGSDCKSGICYPSKKCG